MANEATLLTRLAHPIHFTVADGTGIEKGTILKLTDPWTASASDGIGDAIAGIAAAEKIASDGKISLAAYREGIFRTYLSGACTVGDPLCSAGLNSVQVPVAALSGAQVLGIAGETGTNGETIKMILNIGAAAGTTG